MRKYYSFVAIVAVALASVFVCASCSKDEPGNETGNGTSTEVPNESLTKDLTLVLNNELYEYGEVTVTVTQDGKTNEYKSSATSGEETIEFKDINENPVSLTGKAISIKGLKLNATVNCVYTAKDNAMDIMPERVTCKYAYKTVTLGGPQKVISPNGFVMTNLAKEKVVEYLNKRLEILQTAIAKNPFNEKKQDE